MFRVYAKRRLLLSPIDCALDCGRHHILGFAVARARIELSSERLCTCELLFMQIVGHDLDNCAFMCKNSALELLALSCDRHFCEKLWAN